MVAFEFRVVLKPNVCLYTVISLLFELCKFARILATVLEKYMYHRHTRDEEEWLHIMRVMMLPNERDIDFPFSHSRVVVRYAGCSYTNCSFQIMCRSTHAQMVCQKETTMRVWNHISPVVSHIQYLSRNQTSPTVEQLFNICRTSIPTCSFRVIYSRHQ